MPSPDVPRSRSQRPPPAAPKPRRTYVLAVRVPPEIYDAVRRLARTPALRAQWLRTAITKALRPPPPTPGSHTPPPSGQQGANHGVSHKAGNVKRRVRQQAMSNVPKKAAAAQEGVMKTLQGLKAKPGGAAA